jgi:hypothetical protein
MAPWQPQISQLAGSSNASFHALVVPLSLMTKVCLLLQPERLKNSCPSSLSSHLVVISYCACAILSVCACVRARVVRGPQLSYTATTGSYFNASDENATVDGWERPLTHNPPFGMRALCFVDHAAARAVIAFRGTDLDNRSASGQADACADSLLWEGFEPAWCRRKFSSATIDYLAAALSFAATARSRYPSLDFLYTGHSLGAGLAFAVAAIEGGRNGSGAGELPPAVAFASPNWVNATQRRGVPLPRASAARRAFYALADEWDPVQRLSLAASGLAGVQCLWRSPEPPSCAKCYAHLPYNFSTRPECRLCFELRHVYAHYLEVDVPGPKAGCAPIHGDEKGWLVGGGLA